MSDNVRVVIGKPLLMKMANNSGVDSTIDSGLRGGADALKYSAKHLPKVAPIVTGVGQVAVSSVPKPQVMGAVTDVAIRTSVFKGSEYIAKHLPGEIDKHIDSSVDSTQTSTHDIADTIGSSILGKKN